MVRNLLIPSSVVSHPGPHTDSQTCWSPGTFPACVAPAETHHVPTAGRGAGLETPGYCGAVGQGERERTYFPLISVNH